MGLNTTRQILEENKKNKKILKDEDIEIFSSLSFAIEMDKEIENLQEVVKLINENQLNGYSFIKTDSTGNKHTYLLTKIFAKHKDSNIIILDTDIDDVQLDNAIKCGCIDAVNQLRKQLDNMVK